VYNVQHDCPRAQCTASGSQPVMQERVESGLMKSYIEHQALERFVINTHAFHNTHLLRATLPRSLVVPIPLHQDRQAKHVEIAGRLRATQGAKRIATKARAAQKKQAVADGPGPGPSKRTRLEIEEAIPTEIPHLPSGAETSNLPEFRSLFSFQNLPTSSLHTSNLRAR
jgi:hypothetical protein